MRNIVLDIHGRVLGKTSTGKTTLPQPHQVVGFSEYFKRSGAKVKHGPSQEVVNWYNGLPDLTRKIPEISVDPLFRRLG